MSRRVLFGIAFAAVLVLAFAGFAWAQTPTASETPATTAPVAVTETASAPTDCPNGKFVDNDGDGLCDYREDAATGQQGPGGRMGRMMGGMMQSGQNFVDTDDDGVCDHMEDGTGMQRGQANRQGMGRMSGNGMNNGMGRGWNR